MVNFGDALRKGLRFSAEPKRWLPLLALDAAVLAVALAVLMSGMGPIVGSLLEAQSDPLAMAPLTGYVVGFTLLGIAWYVLRIWIMGSLIHQSARPGEIRKGYTLSLSRLHRVIVAILLTAIISGLAGMVPYLGPLFSIVVSLLLFFIFQGIIIDNLGAVSTIKNSWGIFRKSPLDVSIAWLLIALVSSCIMLVFALPLLIVFFGFMFSSMMASGVAGSGTAALLAVQLQSNLSVLAPLLLIAVVGLELSQAFAIKAQTELYLQFRKRFPDIWKVFRGKAGRFF